MEEKPHTTYVSENFSDDLPDTTVHGYDRKAEHVRSATVMMMQIGPPIILIFGTVGNIMIIMLFGRQQSASSLSLYFKVLAVCDLCLLYTGLLPDWIHHGFGFAILGTHMLVCKLVTLLYYTVGVLSAWIVVAMTSQRAASVIWPHKVNLMCTKRKALFYVIGLTVFIFLLNSHILVGMSVFIFPNSTESLCVRTLYTTEYSLFISKIWPWIDAAMFSLLPFAILAVSNSVLVWKVTDSVRKARISLASGQSDQLSSRTKRVSSMTVTLIAVSCTFFLLSSPLSLYFIITPYTTPYGILNPFQQAKRLFAFYFLHLLWYSNSAVNFYLYCLTGSKFRNQILEMCCGKRKEQATSSISTQISESVISGKLNETRF